MPGFFQTRRADRDLLQIFTVIARDNPSAAERTIERFEELFHRLAANPHLGEQYRTLRRRDVRRFPMGSYVVFYQTIADEVMIMHVRHAARGTPPKL